MTLKQYLKKNGIEMQWFAREKLNVHPVTLTKWLSGVKAIGSSWVEAIEKYTEGQVSFKDWPNVKDERVK